MKEIADCNANKIFSNSCKRIINWLIFLFGAVENPLPNRNGIVKKRLWNF